MSTIRFNAKLFKIGSWTLLRLPEDASAKLPSRGMVMANGAINGSTFQTALEPDGRKSHWFRVDEAMRKDAHLDAGDTVEVTIEPVKEWPEPKVSADLKEALTADPKAYSLWKVITSMARWDWI